MKVKTSTKGVRCGGSERSQVAAGSVFTGMQSLPSIENTQEHTSPLALLVYVHSHSHFEGDIQT